MLLAGCKNNKNNNGSSVIDNGSSSSQTSLPDESSEDPVPEGKVRFHIPASLNEKKNEYKLDIDFDVNIFKQEATSFHKDLAILSFGSALTNQNKELIEGFFDNMGFDNGYACEYYDVKPTEESIGYYISHIKVDNDDLIAVSIRGWNYEKEWSSNLKMGETGNHQGFDESATIVYNKLQEYISANYTESTLKLWIAGYSRAGGVSNVLASKILSNTDIEVEPENMFVYTFEAPRGLLLENAIEYPNVFNLVNAPDIVPTIAPAAYGMYRCGIDINTYDVNVDNIVKQFDSGITLPAFMPYEQIDEEDTPLFNNEVEFTQYLISSLLKEDANWINEEKGWTLNNTAMNTRERFVNNYQESIRYLLAMFFSLSDETVGELVSSLSGLSAILALLGEDGIYNFLKPALEKDQVSFDDDKLKESCNTLMPKLALTVGAPLVSAFVNYGDNFTRMIDMHMPEVNLALINNLVE